MVEAGTRTGRDGERPRRARGIAGFIALTAAMLVAVTILAGLGTWQLQRLGWKEALIARVEAGLGAPPVPAPGPAAWAGFEIDRWQFRPVEATGRFLPGEAHVWIGLTRPKGPLGGPGYFVIAPFETTGGWTVLVNRGFVPEAMKAPEARPQGAPPDTAVELVGLVRESETPSFVAPEPDLAKNVWFAREKDAMAAALGVDPARTAPYFIDAVAAMTPPGGVPQAGETRLDFPNNHLQYALTWYGLALTCVAVFAVFAARRQPRRPGR